MNQSWDVIRNQVRQFRSDLSSIYPVQALAVVKEFYIYNNTLYFLSNNRTPIDLIPSRYLNIYKVDLSQFNSLHNSNQEETLTLLKNSIAFTDYTALEEKEGSSYYRQFRLPGVTTITITKDTILFTFNNGIYVGNIDSVPKLIPHKSIKDINLKSRSNSPSSPITTHIDTTLLTPTNYDPPIRADPKLGGLNNNLVAFIRDCDIWITDFDGNEKRLTFSSSLKDTRCGIAEYMMQEEFHRFTGYYWCPNANKILYLETTEKDVETIYISKAEHSIRYPRAGKINAKSELKIIEFGDKILKYQLWDKNDLKEQFPWMEYIVRFGWLPDGKSIWVQILSRDQKRTAVLKLYPSQFTITPIINNNIDRQTTATEILWEETSTCWINITDVYYFFNQQSTSNCIKFIWSSEKENGFRHLFYIEKYKNEEKSRIKQLTHGEWCCIDKPLYVDELNDLVYFSAKKESPLETHFYSVNYNIIGEPKRWTKKGYSHNVTMIAPDFYVDCFSTLYDPQTVIVRHIKKETSALLFPVVPINIDCTNKSPTNNNTATATNTTTNTNTTITTCTDITIPSNINGEIFSFTTSDGVLLYGCLYKPRFYQPDKSYPTILHIYGGPKTQLVMNEFKFPRLMRYLMSVYFGFAVVIIDSRGSSDRGLKFESYLQHNLGTVELKDQMEGLQFLHDTKFGNDKGTSVVDLNRIAITGWSYGGYLSLMALAQYPGFFKMAIAGAPVTQWELYDAAYTERYMGLPKDHPLAYKKSNILTYVDKFPDNENRLLIAHGLIDENVHFKNTEMLVSELVKHNKPHYLQVYPSEKHGLRHASVNEHFETLMFYWLINYL